MTESVILEEVGCSLCQSRHCVPILAEPDRVHQVPGTFTLCRCLNCGLVYQNPRPAARSFHAIYSADYLPHQPIDATSRGTQRELAATCDLIHRLQPLGGRLLDVGCGSGSFLVALRQRLPHWSMVGIEPDADAAALARQYHIDVRVCRLEESCIEQAAWDAVTMWNVLEHLPNPKHALQHIHGLLRPQGLLYVAVPLCDSWDARIFGRYWLGWELPRHFVIFSRETLQSMLAQTGFELIASASLNGVEYCFTESLRLMLQERIRSYSLRKLGIAATHMRPFRFALQPYLQLAARLRRCTIFTGVARVIPPVLDQHTPTHGPPA